MKKLILIIGICILVLLGGCANQKEYSQCVDSCLEVEGYTYKSACKGYATEWTVCILVNESLEKERKHECYNECKWN